MADRQQPSHLLPVSSPPGPFMERCLQQVSVVNAGACRKANGPPTTCDECASSGSKVPEGPSGRNREPSSNANENMMTLPMTLARTLMRTRTISNEQTSRPRPWRKANSPSFAPPCSTTPSPHAVGWTLFLRPTQSKNILLNVFVLFFSVFCF